MTAREHIKNTRNAVITANLETVRKAIDGAIISGEMKEAPRFS